MSQRDRSDPERSRERQREMEAALAEAHRCLAERHRALVRLASPGTRHAHALARRDEHAWACKEWAATKRFLRAMEEQAVAELWRERAAQVERQRRRQNFHPHGGEIQGGGPMEEQDR